MNNRKRTALCLLGAALCVFMTFGAALALGRYPITPAALLAGDAMAVRTFTVLRLPRAVMALIGGFGLGAAGFVYQTVFRNPLASPDIIGVSSGASVGAAFAILFVSSGALSTTVCAFAGGLAAVFLSLGLAAAAPGRSKMSLVLAGIAGVYPASEVAVGEVVAVAEERVEGLPERYADAYRPTFAVPGLRTAVSNSVARSGAAPAGAEVENMEGAAFFAVAAALGVPAAEVRAVSNRVGEPFGVWRVADACEALARELALLVGEIGSVSSLD